METKDLLNFTSALERGELAASAELSWEGNPAEINPKIIEGQMIFQNGSGRFVQEQDQPVLKFLSSFHVPSLFRRMLGREDINESDQGFNFTDLEGTIRLDKGKVTIQEPLIVRASGGKFQIWRIYRLGERYSRYRFNSYTCQSEIHFHGLA